MAQDAYVVFHTVPFEGYKLGRSSAGKMFVAINNKRVEEARKLNKDLCIIQKPNKYALKSKKKGNTLAPYMIVANDEIPYAFSEEFEDKWGRTGKYTLFYYEWKPIVQSTLF